MHRVRRVYVGDPVIFADYPGEESPSLTFVARTQARRPLYTSAGKRTLPANIPDNEMHRLLRALVLMTRALGDSS